MRPTAIALLILSLLVRACREEHRFVTPTERQDGELCFTFERTDSPGGLGIDCYAHTLQRPYLIIDYYSNELWNYWPKVYSLSGHQYVASEFSDNLIGLAIQDLCEDSVVLRYHSVFGDSVDILTPVYPQSQLEPDFDVLSDLAHYRMVNNFTSVAPAGYDRIDLYIEEHHCFGGSWNRYMIAIGSPAGSITAYAGNGSQLDTSYTVEKATIEEIYREITVARQFSRNWERSTYAFIYLKAGDRVLRLSSDRNQIDSLLKKFRQYEPATKRGLFMDLN